MVCHNECAHYFETLVKTLRDQQFTVLRYSTVCSNVYYYCIITVITIIIIILYCIVIFSTETKAYTRKGGRGTLLMQNIFLMLAK